MTADSSATLCVMVLAAGEGKRMASALPKVVHPVGGKPMLARVLDTARALQPAHLVVVCGHGAERVRDACAGADLKWVLQETRQGTGHAVAQALGACPDTGVVLVLYGDVPLVRAESLQSLVGAAADGALGILTVSLPNPTGYGRILRDRDGRVSGIVEEKDATHTQRGIDECNTGFLAAPMGRLRAWVASLGNDNAQGEYYLTDVVAMAASGGDPVVSVSVEDPAEVMGANDRVQLAALEGLWRARCARELMMGGVTLADPARVDVRGQVRTGIDCSIDINVVLEGDVELGRNVHIGPNCLIRNAVLDDGCVIHANCVVEGARVGPGCQVGPYARLRPGSRLESGARVGNFVEIKNSTLGSGAKASHLSYLGDATVGKDVNVGAGTITCNYDGANKHVTTIADEAFIGSNTALVAPVTIGRGATVAAGSTVTQDVPDGALVVERSKARLVERWVRPVKKR